MSSPFYIIHAKLVSKIAILETRVPVYPNYSWQFVPRFSFGVYRALFIFFEDVGLTSIVYHKLAEEGLRVNVIYFLLLPCLFKPIVYVLLEHHASYVSHRSSCGFHLLETISCKVPVYFILCMSFEKKLQFLRKISFVHGQQSILIYCEVVILFIGSEVIYLLLFPTQHYMLTDIKYLVLEIFSLKSTHTDLVLLHFLLKRGGIGQEIHYFSKCFSEECLAGLSSKEVRLDSWKIYHVLFCIVDNAKLIVPFHKRTMIHIKETEIPCSYPTTAFIYIHIFLYLVQPFERLCKQYILFNKDTAFFVEDMERYESSLDSIEMVLEVTVRLLYHPILEALEHLIDLF